MNQRAKFASSQRGEPLGAGTAAYDKRSDAPHPGPPPRGRSGKWRRYALYVGASLAVVVCLALGATWGLIDSFGPA